MLPQPLPQKHSPWFRSDLGRCRRGVLPIRLLGRQPYIQPNPSFPPKRSAMERPASQAVPDRIAGRGAEAEARLRAHSKRAESLTMIAQKNPVSVKMDASLFRSKRQTLAMPDKITRRKITIRVICNQIKPPISLKTNSIRGPHGGGILSPTASMPLCIAR